MDTSQQEELEEKEQKKIVSCDCLKNSPLFQDTAASAVFWQSAFYLFLSILAPLQGWLNMLVYTRPRFVKWRQTKKMEKERKRKLLERQQKIKERAVMNDARGGPVAVSQQSSRHGQDSTASVTLPTRKEEKPVSVEAEGDGIEEGISDNEAIALEDSAVSEGIDWEELASMSEPIDGWDLDGHSKKFDCLSA
ncbi:unnamed protein product [Cylindrotheca closterium]|uniref:Uncharacterized protein n=1 Tax=Cylindrotheca closterium TaxID=2856 RepID=A0AAD2JNG4_9STRA|nr:unnamed protein product [Cylindrotheca closterium]